MVAHEVAIDKSSPQLQNLTPSKMSQTHMEFKTSSIIDQADIDLCQNHITNACIALFRNKNDHQ
jgi:hypothetical protein